MENQLLNMQSDFVSLQNQYNQLYTKGKEMQYKLLSILQSTPYGSLIKTYNLIEPDSCKLAFLMFGEIFSIYVECAFNEGGGLTNGYLKTYLTDRPLQNAVIEPQVIYSVSFDKIGNIDRRYTIDDFGVPYLMNIVAEYKKYVANRHIYNGYTIILRQFNTSDY